MTRLTGWRRVAVVLLLLGLLAGMMLACDDGADCGANNEKCPGFGKVWRQNTGQPDPQAPENP